MTVRYRATVAYDGEKYQGFQRQAAGIPTVQGALEAAVSAVSGQAVTVIGAGRTDAGVHATGQVIAFDIVGWRHGETALLNAINATLPGDIALQTLCMLGEVEIGKRGFHPRFDARSRAYVYTVISAAQRQPLRLRSAWWMRGSLDGESLAAAAQMLIGEHDFGAFGKPPQGENTVRHVFRSMWERSDEENVTVWRYRVEANAFLQHMVRRMVGAMVAVGRGAMTLADFEQVFRAGVLIVGLPIAPPQGLILEHVTYPAQAGDSTTVGLPAGEDE